MQDSVEQFSESALGNFQKYINPGRVSELLLYFSGTNATATPGALSDLGSLVVKRNGRTIIDRPIKFFGDFLNIRRGSNLFESVGSGTFRASIMIPFYEKSFRQALQITGDTELNFSFSKADGSVFSDLQLTVFSQMSLLDEEYEYHILGNDVTPGGAWSSKNVELRRDNVTNILVGDPGDIVTDLGVRSGGAEVYSLQPKDVIEAKTLANNALEQTTIDLLELQLYTEGEGRSVRNSNNILKVSSGAPSGNTIEITTTQVVRPQQG